MFLHIMPDSNYSVKYIEFIRRNSDHFKQEQHFFLLLKKNRASVTEYPKDVLICRSHADFIKNLLRHRHGKRLVVHGLLDIWLMIFWCLYPQPLKTAIWSIWGIDAYFDIVRDGSLKSQIIEVLRKKIIPQLKLITAMAEGDFRFVVDHYGIKGAKYVRSFYLPPVDGQAIEAAKSRNKQGAGNPLIIVGNSADPSNNHREILDIFLSKFKKESFKLFVPLGYGDAIYKENLSQYIRASFAEKAECSLELIPPDEYAKILANASAVVLNHSRQQGVSTIIAALVAGSKVFIKKTSSLYAEFERLGIRLCSTDQLNELSFSEIIQTSEETRSTNAMLALQCFSEKQCIRSWQKVFDQYAV